jgi:hypothetical protein
MGYCQFSTELFFITTLHWPNRKHYSEQFFYYCLHIRCCENLFTEPLPGNGRLLWLHYSSLQASCHNIFKLWLNSFKNTSLYKRCTCISVHILILFNGGKLFQTDFQGKTRKTFSIQYTFSVSLAVFKIIKQLCQKCYAMGIFPNLFVLRNDKNWHICSECC